MVANLVIENLAEVVSSLPDREQEMFRQVYTVTVSAGEQIIPQSMQPWVRQQFGSVEAVSRQTIVKVTNLITGEETIFNPLRASRPIEAQDKEAIDVERQGDRDLFSDTGQNTPEDIFGRVVGKHCVTASNISKCDGMHGLVIFNEYNPLNFSREQVTDYIDVSWEWAKRAQATRPEAKYFLFIWNCLWRAGASIRHGHAQVMLTTGQHYAKVERLRQAALGYQQSQGSNYFSDLFQVHRSLGCALERDGCRMLASVTPFKDNEVMLIADELSLSLKERIYEVLTCFRDQLGVASFNFSLVTPPLSGTKESWDGFPVIARVLERGDLHNRASDVGGMEIYGASVVSSDPFELTRKLTLCLGRGKEADYG